MTNQPYISYENTNTDNKRIIVMGISEQGHRYVIDILEGEADDLWAHFADLHPNVTHVLTGYNPKNGHPVIEEADCLTTREAAEAVLGA